MSYGIQKGRGTPPPTHRERMLFELLIVPDPRDRSSWPPPSNVGEVLDTPARRDVRCASRRWWCSADGRAGVRLFACGTYACSACVIPKLIDRCAGAWASWGGQAAVVTNETRPESAPGRLWIPQTRPELLDDMTLGDPKYIVFKPAGTTTGRELDEELVRAIRAMPLPPPKPRGTNSALMGWSGGVPDWLTFELADLLAEEHGFRLVRGGRGDNWRPAAPITPELMRAWASDIWTYRSAQELEDTWQH